MPQTNIEPPNDNIYNNDPKLRERKPWYLRLWFVISSSIVIVAALLAIITDTKSLLNNDSNNSDSSPNILSDTLTQISTNLNIHNSNKVGLVFLETFVFNEIEETEVSKLAKELFDQYSGEMHMLFYWMDGSGFNKLFFKSELHSMSNSWKPDPRLKFLNALRNLNNCYDRCILGSFKTAADAIRQLQIQGFQDFRVFLISNMHRSGCTTIYDPDFSSIYSKLNFNIILIANNSYDENRWKPSFQNYGIMDDIYVTKGLPPKL